MIVVKSSRYGLVFYIQRELVEYVIEVTPDHKVQKLKNNLLWNQLD